MTCTEGSGIHGPGYFSECICEHVGNISSVGDISYCCWDLLSPQ